MYKTKILIVEDETIIALDIKNTITKLGFQVTNTVTNNIDAITSVKEEMPDIILMDINLKNSKNGIETTQDIQKIKDIPIIYLTADSDDKTITKAIETNPIGYLSKPFKREELKSTIMLGLYKISKQEQELINNNCVHIGFDYYYDHINHSLYYKNTPIKLSVKERHLLKILIEAKGRIITFEEIEYNIWPDCPVSNSTLRTLIYRLRVKLEYRFIETIPAFGCKLTPSFQL
ncbi:response regulator [Arcobacter sp. LA11]|uniref:response regulator n=1 Tax=Arcobacter sp. LA11 TaxID=1898176 RepID=UPI000933DB43|nr:response regulator [Arcobacter sp. LA11]